MFTVTIGISNGDLLCALFDGNQLCAEANIQAFRLQILLHGAGQLLIDVGEKLLTAHQ